MATISITIAAADLARVVDAIAYQHNYQDTIIAADGTTTPNPETRQQYARRMMISWARACVVSWEANQAAQAARDAAITEAAKVGIT